MYGLSSTSYTYNASLNSYIIVENLILWTHGDHYYSLSSNEGEKKRSGTAIYLSTSSGDQCETDDAPPFLWKKLGSEENKGEKKREREVS